MNLRLTTTERSPTLTYVDNESGLAILFSGNENELEALAKIVSPQINPAEDQSETQTQEEMELEDGSPPGFPGPPQYKQSIRRNRRLETKDQCRYISAINKARLVAGFEEQQTTQKRPKRKSVSERDHNNLRYQESYDPLTATQAELIVSTAGVEVDTVMDNKISELVRRKWKQLATSATGN